MSLTTTIACSRYSDLFWRIPSCQRYLHDCVFGKRTDRPISGLGQGRDCPGLFGEDRIRIHKPPLMAFDPTQANSLPRHNHPLQPRLRAIAAPALIKIRNLKPAPTIAPPAPHGIANRKRAYQTAPDAAAARSPCGTRRCARRAAHHDHLMRCQIARPQPPTALASCCVAGRTWYYVSLCLQARKRTKFSARIVTAIR